MPVQHSVLTWSVSRDSAHQKSPNIPAATAAAAAECRLNDVSSPRRRFPRVSMTPRCPATIPEHPDEELWVDGPRSSVCFTPAAESVSSRTQTCCSDKFVNQSANVSSLHKFATQSTPSSELWVDGPAEFQTQLGDGVSDSRTVGNSAAIARKPVTSNDLEQTVTSSRLSRRSAASHGEGVSKCRLPRTSASKNHSHSSPRLRHSAQPVLDGRITAWVKSVQQANQLSDADLRQPDLVNESESQELQETGSVDLEEKESHGNVEVLENDETSSVANSNQSLYERQVDESLETASLCGCALISSDDDAVSPSNCGVGQLRDGVPDGCAADDKLYTELPTLATKDNIPLSNITEDVSRTPVASSGTSGRSRLVEPLVRSTSNSSRHGSSSPAAQQSSSFPHRCLSSPGKNSLLRGSQSPVPSTVKCPSTPSSVHRCSNAVDERPSGVVELDKILTNVSSQKSVNAKAQQSKSRGPRTVDRSHRVIGKSSPTLTKLDRRSNLAATVKKTSDSVNRPWLMSPYQTVTSPRRRRAAGCSTSSDNSSQLSDAVTARSKSSEVELSSGYESMLRDDSDETITAHCTDDWSTDVDHNHTHGE